MTDREQELLKWIQEDPLISQQELARKAGITRSSVAVHIANLMKKGKIKGRGYIVQEEAYMVVVGAVNVDITGTSETAMVPADSNPGRVTMALGGVGRNIAENLSRMGVPVVMLTVVGDDAYAKEIQKNCRELGIDLSHSLTAPGQRTSAYLCLNDADGEIVAAVSDMDIYQRITPAFLESRLELMNRASLVVVDANIPEESVQYLAEHVRVPLVADPVSVKKAGRLKACLGRFAALKPNRPEARLLTGVTIKGRQGLEEAARVMLDQGTQNVFISLGPEGVFYSDGRHAGVQPCYPGRVVNTTGCGDAFVAAAALGFAKGFDIRRTARMGQAASSICAGSAGAVSQEISMENILKIIDQTEE